MPKPNVQKSAPPPGSPNQPQPKTISNEPGKTLKEALDNNRRLVEEANNQ